MSQPNFKTKLSVLEERFQHPFLSVCTVSPRNAGTATTPFRAYLEKDVISDIDYEFQSITSQQPYQAFSFEELRLADYNAGRRYSNVSAININSAAPALASFDASKNNLIAVSGSASLGAISINIAAPALTNFSAAKTNIATTGFDAANSDFTAPASATLDATNTNTTRGRLFSGDTASETLSPDAQDETDTTRSGVNPTTPPSNNSATVSFTAPSDDSATALYNTPTSAPSHTTPKLPEHNSSSDSSSRIPRMATAPTSEPKNSAQPSVFATPSTMPASSESIPLIPPQSAWSSPLDMSSLKPEKVNITNANTSPNAKTNVKAEWTHHNWDGQTVRHLLSSSTSRSSSTSTKTLCFANDESPAITVHKALFDHFSRSEIPILYGCNDNPQEVFELFIAWLYTGECDLTAGSENTYRDLTNLYVFATRINSLALRRWIINKLRSHMHFPPRLFQTSRSTRILPTIPDVQHAFASLSAGSPLLEWLIEVFITHYEPSSDHGYKDADWLSLPPDFLAPVMIGKSRLLEKTRQVQVSAATLWGNGDSAWLTRQCLCCGSNHGCEFHEHESELERMASCGGDKILKDAIFRAAFAEKSECASEVDADCGVS